MHILSSYVSISIIIFKWILMMDSNCVSFFGVSIRSSYKRNVTIHICINVVTGNAFLQWLNINSQMSL